jgi:5-methylcytosine-specific restriction endonuclease McrBC GTP-binding regulatory subunit McrB
VTQAGQVKTLADYDAVLNLARRLHPDFPALSHKAWLQAQSSSQVAVMDGGRFPFAQYQADVGQYSGDRVKGNLVLDRKYAPLLLDLMSGDWTVLKPSRSPYSGREQLAVKVSLGGGVKMDSGAFSRALLFADDSGFEYVSFPAGLTLEAGLPDGKGDGPRQALQDPGTWARVLALLNSPLPGDLSVTLTLNTDFGPLSLLPLGAAQGDAQSQSVEEVLDRYRQGMGRSRRLRVGLSLQPHHLESEAFPDLLDASLNYMDDLLVELEHLMSQPAAAPLTGGTEPVIEVTGTQAVTQPPQAFQPIPGVPLNQILYGPPGTGKTYRVVEEALAVLDPDFLADHAGREGRAARKARYDELVAQGGVSFITFHQSFGYENFIEGLKPVMTGGHLSYHLEDGVFLKAVKAAGGTLAPAMPEPVGATSEALVRPDAHVWRMYIDGVAPISQLRERTLARGEIRVGSRGSAVQDLTGKSYDVLSEQKILFRDGVRVGDLVLLATGADHIGGVGVVTGEYRFDPAEPIFAADYAHARSVKWLATGLNINATAALGKPFSQQTLQRVFGISAGQVLDVLKLSPAQDVSPPSSAGPQGLRPHVLVIDEINRGNISKIFGELITLLESSKRAGAPEALSVTLPLSRRTLSIPQSLYVIGTMNTADRSLTLLDAALRRRFVFKPVWPEPELLPVLTLDGTGLDLRKFLFVINDRIERFLSREQVIGHAYLLGLPATLEGVASAVRERILPLLEEYFFEDWNKIREVLGDHGKPPEAQFIHQTGKGSEVRYRLNPQAFGNIEAFTGVYAQVSDEAFPFNA